MKLHHGVLAFLAFSLCFGITHQEFCKPTYSIIDRFGDETPIPDMSCKLQITCECSSKNETQKVKIFYADPFTNVPGNRSKSWNLVQSQGFRATFTKDLSMALTSYTSNSGYICATNDSDAGKAPRSLLVRVPFAFCDTFESACQRCKGKLCFYIEDPNKAEHVPLHYCAFEEIPSKISSYCLTDQINNRSDFRICHVGKSSSDLITQDYNVCLRNFMHENTPTPAIGVIEAEGNCSNLSRSKEDRANDQLGVLMSQENQTLKNRSQESKAITMEDMSIRKVRWILTSSHGSLHKYGFVVQLNGDSGQGGSKLVNGDICASRTLTCGNFSDLSRLSTAWWKSPDTKHKQLSRRTGNNTLHIGDAAGNYTCEVTKGFRSCANSGQTVQVKFQQTFIVYSCGTTATSSTTTATTPTKTVTTPTKTVTTPTKTVTTPTKTAITSTSTQATPSSRSTTPNASTTFQRTTTLIRNLTTTSREEESSSTSSFDGSTTSTSCLTESSVNETSAASQYRNVTECGQCIAGFSWQSIIPIGLVLTISVVVVIILTPMIWRLLGETGFIEVKQKVPGIGKTVNKVESKDRHQWSVKALKSK